MSNSRGREHATDTPAPIPVEDLRGHGERILVVDDNGGQRDIASELLERLECVIEVAASGGEALTPIHAALFDIVVLELTKAPAIGGGETSEAIPRLRPGHPAIVATGFIESEDIQRTLEMGAGESILKSHTIERMGAAVREQLRRHGE